MSKRSTGRRIIPIEEEIQQSRFDDLAEKAMVNVIYSANLFLAQTEIRLKPFGITLPQYNILRILRGQHGKPIALNEVKRRMLDRNPDVSRIVDRLVKKGLVAKTTCSADKRQADLTLAPAGLDILASTDVIVRETSAAQRELKAADLERLNHLLDRLRCGQQIPAARVSEACLGAKA